VIPDQGGSDSSTLLIAAHRKKIPPIKGVGESTFLD